MEIRPIVSALGRNKLGAILIALQIALTLAILCNGLFVVFQRVQRMQRPSGIDEDNIVVLTNTWIGTPDDIKSLLSHDLAALRALPDVEDAYATRSIPLGGSGWGTGIDLQPDQKNSTAEVGVYHVDDHALRTLGLRLLAGNWFTADDIGQQPDGDHSVQATIVITRALAEKLFPGGVAVGKSVYMNDKSTTIIGVVDRLQVPWSMTHSMDESAMVENSVLMPYLFQSRNTLYVIRAKPGRAAAVLQAAKKKLLETDRLRLIGPRQTEPFAQLRADAYRGDRALIVLLSVVCSLLLGVTALGIVGLTSYWVSQRRKQIGIRRALGAQRADILRYFHSENLLIAGTGVAFGIVLAFGANQWMMRSFEMTRIGLPLVLGAAFIVLALGQLAVLWPALRAASIPPTVALRAI